MDYLHFFFFFFLATLHSMWDLSSPTRYQTWAPALEVWSLNHWTTREVPHRLLHITYLKSAFSLSFFPFSLIYLFIYLFCSLKPCCLSILFIWQKPSCHWHSPFPQHTERYHLSRPGRNVLLCSLPACIFLLFLSCSLDHLEFFQGIKVRYDAEKTQ